MATAVSDLYVQLTGDVGPLAGSLASGQSSLRGFRTAVGQVDASLAGMAQTANGTARSGVGGLLSGVGSLGAGLLALSGVAVAATVAVGGVFAVKGIGLAEQYETAGVQLRALTGSAGQASSMLAGLRQFAADSPFAFPELLESSRRLLAVGYNAGAIVPLLREVGDVAAGVGAPINDVTEAFTRAAAEGTVGSRELREFGRQGIPIVQALAERFHTTTGAIGDMATAGRIGVADLKGAFDTLTAAGGKFGGIVAAQSATLGGSMHRLSAVAQDAAADVAGSLVSAFNVPAAVGGLADAFGRVAPSLVAGINAVAPYVRGFVGSTALAFASLYSAVAPVLGRLWSAVGTGFATVVGVVGVVERYGGPIRAAVGGAFAALAAAGLPAAFGAVAAAAVSLGGAVLTVAGAVATPLAAFVALGAVAGVVAQRFGLVERATSLVSAVAGYVSANWRSMLDAVATAAVGVYSVAAAAFADVYAVGSAVWGAVSGVVRAAWEGITAVTSAGVNYVGQAFGLLGGAGRGMAMTFAVATAAATYGLAHLGDVANLAGVTAAAALVRLGNQAQYTLTQVIPAYLAFAGRQVVDVFGDLLHNSAAVFENLTGNVVRVMSNLPGLIKGSVKFGDLWQPLTDGFRVTMEGLPQIAARQAGPLESALDAQAAALRATFGGGVADAVAAQADRARRATQSLLDAVGGVLGKAKPATLPQPNVTPPDPVKVVPLLDPSALTLGITPEIKRAKITLAGSAEALAARYGATHPLPVAVSPAQPQSLAGAVQTPAALPPPGAMRSAAAPRAAPLAGVTAAAATATTQRQAVAQAQHNAQLAAAAQAAAQQRARTAMPADRRAAQAASADAAAQVAQARSALQAARKMAQPLPSSPPAPTPVAAQPPPDSRYQRFGRTELTDSRDLGGGLHAARTSDRGIGATLTDDMLARVKAAANPAPDAFARFMASRPPPAAPAIAAGGLLGTFAPMLAAASMAVGGAAAFNPARSVAPTAVSSLAADPATGLFGDAVPPVTMPPVAQPTVPNVPGVDATRDEVARTGAAKLLDESKKQTAALTTIATNTAASTVATVSIG